MFRPTLKTFAFAGLLGLVGLAAYIGFRRSPACSNDGKLMSTQSECQAWGIDAATCEQAVGKAREAVVRKAPKTDNMFACEVRFSDCFQAPDGGFAPRPTFCLRVTDKGAEPSDIRYLEYESDRLNRKKMREVRVD
jgi:uncharacterized protein YgiB involved in biofilm formation